MHRTTPVPHQHAAGPVAFLLACVLLAHAAPSLAQDWAPPQPTSEKWDWIQMSSGEWLKGEIQSLRDTALEFESDEFDVLTVDWDDVAVLRTARVFSIRVQGAGTFTGTALLEAGVLHIRALDGSLSEYPQDRVLVMVSGSGREIDYWYAKATMGFVARSGNTDQADFNTNTRIRRRTPRSRLLLGYIANMGRVQGETNIENHNASGAFDMVIRSGFFITPLSVNYFRDRFQNIDSKSTIATGFGYQIMDRSAVEWDVGLSGGYQNTRFSSVQAGEGDREENFSLIPTMTLAIDITSDIEFDFDYNSQVAIPETQRAFHHMNGILSVDLVGDLLSLDFSLSWDRTESPKQDSAGNTPKRDDFRMSFGIGVEL